MQHKPTQERLALRILETILGSLPRYLERNDITLFHIHCMRLRLIRFIINVLSDVDHMSKFPQIA